jgi:hypothetical protein
MPRKREPTDPDKLRRESAGRYRTADGRFAVSGEPGGSWYLADDEQANEFGLPRLIGPYPTLVRVREAIREMRAGIAEGAAPGVAQPSPGKPQLTVIPGGAGEGATERPATPPRRGAKQEPAETMPEAAGSKPGSSEAAESSEPSGESVSAEPVRVARRPAGPAWLERLDPKERARLRRVIAALERLDVVDAEMVVRAETRSGLPQTARALLVHTVWQEVIDVWRRESGAVEGAAEALGPRVGFGGVDAAVKRLLDGEPEDDDLPMVARLVAFRSAAVLLEALARGRPARRDPRRELPGWRLVEADKDGEPTGRTMQLSEDDLLRSARPAVGPDAADDDRD